MVLCRRSTKGGCSSLPNYRKNGSKTKGLIGRFRRISFSGVQIRSNGDQDGGSEGEPACTGQIIQLGQGPEPQWSVLGTDLVGSRIDGGARPEREDGPGTPDHLSLAIFTQACRPVTRLDRIPAPDRKIIDEQTPPRSREAATRWRSVRPHGAS